MPNIKSAKKKVRIDKKRTKINSVYLVNMNKAIKSIIKLKDKTKLTDLIKKAYSLIDKAAKKRVIHKNKAARLKSRVTKLTKTKK